LVLVLGSRRNRSLEPNEMRRNYEITFPMLLGDGGFAVEVEAEVIPAERPMFYDSNGLGNPGSDEEITILSVMFGDYEISDILSQSCLTLIESEASARAHSGEE